MSKTDQLSAGRQGYTLGYSSNQDKFKMKMVMVISSKELKREVCVQGLIHFSMPFFIF